MRPAIVLAASLPLLLFSLAARAGDEVRERAAKKACLIGDTAKGVEILADLFIDTNDPVYIFNQGRCFEQNRLYEDAIARFREFLVKAKNLDPEVKADAEQHIAACQSYVARNEGSRPANPEAGKAAPGPAAVTAQALASAAPPGAAPDTARQAPPAGEVPTPAITLPEAAPQHNRRAPGTIWLAFGAGSGAAYHGLQAVDSRSKGASGVPVPVAASFSPASLFQLEPELGVQVSERFALSIMARYQYAPKDDSNYVPGSGEQAILTSAMAGFLRAEFSYLNMGNFRSYLSGGMGAGTSFLAVVSKDCDMNSCPLSHSDTLHGGALGLLGGLGAIYHLTPNIGLFVDVKEIVTFRTVLALTEVNLGVAVAYNPW